MPKVSWRNPTKADISDDESPQQKPSRRTAAKKPSSPWATMTTMTMTKMAQRRR
jgi:hypothetical protein